MSSSTEMTSVERIQRILQRKPVDRIGVFEHFWGDTLKQWTAQGHLREGESVAEHFGFDILLCGCLDMVADLDFVPETVDETEDTVLLRDGNGALLRRHKRHDATPEHVDFRVRDRAGWEAHIKPVLAPERRRIDFESYRRVRREAAEQQCFFAWAGVNVFELMHPVCGHEHMLTGMAMDPDWVREMCAVYADTTIALLETLFSEEGPPDGLWFYEDMGFKQRPFMSLNMYRDIIQPAHRRTIGWAHERGLPVIMHSCGFVEPLLPGMMEAGVDALQVIEVKAGMDLLKLYHEYGDGLTFIGGIDVRCLYGNDRAAIDAELETKIPVVMGKHGYVLHSDHSIPDQVEYENYRYFVDRGVNLGRYSRD